MAVMFLMHTVQLTYFRFSTRKFSMVDSYTEGWALAQGWVLALDNTVHFLVVIVPHAYN